MTTTVPVMVTVSVTCRLLLPLEVAEGCSAEALAEPEAEPLEATVADTEAVAATLKLGEPVTLGSREAEEEALEEELVLTVPVAVEEEHTEAEMEMLLLPDREEDREEEGECV